jgi:phosphohistidine phosphatase SixA
MGQSSGGTCWQPMQGCYHQPMQSNFQRLKRRPFLVPLLMPLALLLLVIGAAIWLLDARTSTVLILVRHAELEQLEVATPKLSGAGIARALNLQLLLTKAKPERGIDAVYVSQDSPSQQTAAPLAQSMGLAVNVVAAPDWDAVSRFITRNHGGEVVLVVGTRAAMLSVLKHNGAANFTIDEEDYSSVLVISRSRLSKPTVVRLRY